MEQVFRVNVMEYLEKDVFVLAKDEEDAYNLVKSAYQEGKIILDASDFVETLFEVDEDESYEESINECINYNDEEARAELENL